MTPDEAATLGQLVTPHPWPWVGTDRAWKIEGATAEPMADDHLVAWRCDWTLVAKRRRHGRWLHAVCEATLRAGGPRDLPPHDAPYTPCTCGFYAAKRPRRRWAWLPFHQIWRVELAGMVIEHTEGWRAQRIRYLFPV